MYCKPLERPTKKWSETLRDKLFLFTYSHLSNNRGGLNKRGGRAKVAK